MDAESADLDAVPARDAFDERRLAGDFDKLLACVTVLVEGADVAGGDLMGEGDVDCVLFWKGVNSRVRLADGRAGGPGKGNGRPGTYVDALEPDGNVRDECHGRV